MIVIKDFVKRNYNSTLHDMVVLSLHNSPYQNQRYNNHKVAFHKVRTEGGWGVARRRPPAFERYILTQRFFLNYLNLYSFHGI